MPKPPCPNSRSIRYRPIFRGSADASRVTVEFAGLNVRVESSSMEQVLPQLGQRTAEPSADSTT